MSTFNSNKRKRDELKMKISDWYVQFMEEHSREPSMEERAPIEPLLEQFNAINPIYLRQKACQKKSLEMFSPPKVATMHI